MFYEVLINFLVELCYVWMIGVYFSELISIVDFGEYVRWDRFISFLDIASGYEFFISL